MNEQTVQIIKSLTGTLVSLACLAALAFERHLGADFGEEGRVALLGLAFGGTALGGHGLYKMEPKSPGGGEQ